MSQEGIGVLCVRPSTIRFGRPNEDMGRETTRRRSAVVVTVRSNAILNKHVEVTLNRPFGAVKRYGTWETIIILLIAIIRAPFRETGGQEINGVGIVVERP